MRKATIADLKELCRLEKESFDEESFSSRQMRYLLLQAKADFLLLEVSGAIGAYLILLRHRRRKALRIYSIAVSRQHQGKGLARQLLREAEKLARQGHFPYLSLEVSERNARAISLYLRNGFSVFGERPDYYKDGSKALLMRKVL